MYSFYSDEDIAANQASLNAMLAYMQTQIASLMGLADNGQGNNGISPKKIFNYIQKNSQEAQDRINEFQDRYRNRITPTIEEEETEGFERQRFSPTSVYDRERIAQREQYMKDNDMWYYPVNPGYDSPNGKVPAPAEPVAPSASKALRSPSASQSFLDAYLHS